MGNKPLGLLELDELEVEINNKIDSIKQIVDATNPLLNLILIELYRLFHHIGNFGASIHGDISPGWNKIQDTIQSLIVTTSKNLDDSNFISEENLKKLIEDIEQLFIVNSCYINVIEKDDLIKYSQGMNTNVSGKLYPYFEEEHFNSLIMPYSEVCEQIFSLTGDKIVEGLLKISLQLRTNGLMKIIPDFRNRVENLEIEKVFEYADYFNVKSITGWPIEFIKEFALSIGESNGYYLQDLEIMNKEMPIIYKPFLKYRDRFYCFSIDNLLDNFYRAFVKVLRKVKPELSSKINEIQKDLSEELPFDLLNKLLPKATIYKNIYYKAPVGANGRNEWCECDGIIIYDDVMIIVEVKAGAISPASPFSDEESFKNSLKELTGNPYNQTIRFYEEYSKENKIEIYNKESKKKYQFIKEIKNINFVQACCVTLDDLNEIAAQIEKTDLIQYSSLPVWCISLGDLRVYTEILESPSHFLNYLYQRSKATRNKSIKLNDELDHLGMYLSYNDYSNYVDELLEDDEEYHGTTCIHFESHREEINEYMAMKLVDKHKSDVEDISLFDIFGFKKDKPKQGMESEFETLISLLDHSKDVWNTRVARYLLILDSHTRGNISEFLRTRTRKLVENRYKKLFYNPYATYNYDNELKINEIPVIMIFLLESSNKLFKDIAVRKRFLMERVINPEENTICILVGINREGNLKKILTHTIETDFFEKLDKSSYALLQQMRENIKTSRITTEW